MENTTSPNDPYFWTNEVYNESETAQISESIAQLNLSLQQGSYEEPVPAQQTQEVPASGVYCNMTTLMPNFAGASNMQAEIQNTRQEVMQVEEVANKRRSRSATLAQLLVDELEDVSDEIFFETKWKIIDVLREAQKKQRNQRSLQEQLMLNRDRFDSSSSPSIITLPSPTSSTSPLLSEWAYEEQS